MSITWALATLLAGWSGTTTGSMDVVYDALRLQRGCRVADIGAGASGSATFPMAKLVGEEGRVWAVDIDERRAIPELRKRAEREGLPQVEVVVGEATDPKLPQEGVDAVLMMNAYHEMEQFETMLGHVKTSLRPGGRLVIVDNVPRKNQGQTRGEQARQHVLAIDFAEGELKAAGFNVVARRDSLTLEGHKPGSLWMLVAERP